MTRSDVRRKGYCCKARKVCLLILCSRLLKSRIEVQILMLVLLVLMLLVLVTSPGLLIYCRVCGQRTLPVCTTSCTIPPQRKLMHSSSSFCSSQSVSCQRIQKANAKMPIQQIDHGFATETRAISDMPTYPIIIHTENEPFQNSRLCRYSLRLSNAASF